jgi:hypothetical protein
MFEEAGLEPDYKLVSSSTKTLSFKKPGELSNGGAAGAPDRVVAST